MLLFVYEYTCAAAGVSLAASLRKEGWAMLAALLQDLNRVPGVETVTLLAPDCRPCAGDTCRLHRMEDERAFFHELAASADATLVIAPEFDGLLAERCRWVLEAGSLLLGPSPTAVELTADKIRLAELLRRHHVPTPPCYAVEDAIRAVAVPFPAVLKPRDGAGSQATCLVRTRVNLAQYLQQMRAEAPRAEFLVQPLVKGMPASVAFLLGPRQEIALVPAAQQVTDDGRFRYLGGVLPLPAPLAARALALGRRAVRALPDLRGYVGVDLILGAAADGSADSVLEINPRLTTSYIGLRALARDNLAAALLRVARGEAIPDLSWHAGPVQFQADGQVVCSPQPVARSGQSP